MAVWIHLACCEDFPLGLFECEVFTFTRCEEVRVACVNESACADFEERQIEKRFALFRLRRCGHVLVNILGPLRLRGGRLLSDSRQLLMCIVLLPVKM